MWRPFTTLAVTTETLLSLCACPQDLPVEHQICFANVDNCSTHARFKTLRTCEYFADVHSRVCTENATGELTCAQPRNEILTSTCSH